ncbi:MAG: prepilin-type N-terminal cleavage/methylation domain-containing protein [Gemmatimonadaceae bacterium]
MRSGFTLIEVLVALVLFQIAIMALAATTVVAARDLGIANRRAIGRQLAENRVATLRAGACAAPESGVSDTQGLRETWHVAAAGRVRVITGSVELVLPRGREELVVRAWVLCAT